MNLSGFTLILEFQDKEYNMCVPDIRAVRLEIGLIGGLADLLSDEEIGYFLEQNNNNIRRASLTCAKIVLFALSDSTHIKSDVLEEWGHDRFNNYYKALNLYLTNPQLNGSLLSATPYGGGISNSDIRANIQNPDNNFVRVDMGIPTDGILPINNDSIFNPQL